MLNYETGSCPKWILFLLSSIDWLKQIGKKPDFLYCGQEAYFFTPENSTGFIPYNYKGLAVWENKDYGLSWLIIETEKDMEEFRKHSTPMEQ